MLVEENQVGVFLSCLDLPICKVGIKILPF